MTGIMSIRAKAWRGEGDWELKVTDGEAKGETPTQRRPNHSHSRSSPAISSDHASHPVRPGG